MPQGEPRSGEKYRHFKDKLYQIITVATHSETGEKLVIYQALYGDFGVYARPYDMFVSPVDREKYPEVKQRFRFELTELEPEQGETARGEQTREPEREEMARAERAGQPAQAGGREQFPVKKPGEVVGQQAEKKTIEELLMDFYDAGTYEEKYRILLDMREDITDVMINNMAVVLDVVIEEGPLERRYEELKQCIRTYRQYETSRF